MRVPVNMLKKYATILSVVFAGVFLIEFICSALGHPLGELYIYGLDLTQNTLSVWLIRAFSGAFLIGGIVNFFLTLRMIKEALGWEHWPTVLVVAMTVLSPIEILLSMVFVIPNIIIFAIIGTIKKRI